jgi:hypothetical protein
MEFRIADTFTDSIARLTSAQQKAVKTTFARMANATKIQLAFMVILPQDSTLLVR